MTQLTLTNRELQVLRLLLLGCSTSVVASELGIALKTAATCREGIVKKLITRKAPTVQKAMTSGA